ncbi:MAG: hypothetical protein ACRD63_12250, partial [Pyrinomonadaceae bacterium]
MNLSLVEKIANTILYEGYILYPYRPSSVKNQQRFNFGALCPQSYSLAQGGTERWSMQTECLVQGSEHAVLNVKVRFLHLVAQEVGHLSTPLSELVDGVEPDFQIVQSLEVNGQIYQTWQEAIEREVSISNLNLHELLTQPEKRTFNYGSKREIERLHDQQGKIVALFVRRQQSIEGRVDIEATQVGDQLFRITVRILNLTPFADAAQKSRDEALMRSFASTHTILELRDGEFVSLLEPPEVYSESVAACHNIGT